MLGAKMLEPDFLNRRRKQMNHELARDHVSLWRKEADGVLEVRSLTLYEGTVWETVQLFSSSKDDDQYSSGMVKDAIGRHASEEWFAARRQELLKDGFTAIKPPAYEPPTK